MDAFPVFFGSALMAVIAWLVMAAIGLPDPLVIVGVAAAFLGTGWLMLTHN